MSDTTLLNLTPYRDVITNSVLKVVNLEMAYQISVLGEDVVTIHLSPILFRAYLEELVSITNILRDSAFIEEYIEDTTTSNLKWGDSIAIVKKADKTTVPVLQYMLQFLN